MYITQRVRTKTGKKAIIFYDKENGVCRHFKTYHFNRHDEAYKPTIGTLPYLELMEELTIDTKDFNWYKKSNYAV